MTRFSLTALALFVLLSSLPSDRISAQDKKADNIRKEEKKQEVKKDDADPEPPDPLASKIKLGKKAWIKKEKLMQGDQFDAGRNNALCKIYVMHFEKDKTYQIDLRSKAFDAYLRILGPDGKQVAYNDDFQGLDSRIVYRATVKGEFKVIAASLNGKGVGEFEIQAKEQ